MNDFEDDQILVDVANFKEKINKSTKKSFIKVLVRSFFSLFSLALILIYIVSPLNKVKINQLSGNFYLTSENVLELANLTTEDSLLRYHKQEIMERLNSSSFVASSKVEWHMTYLNVYIDEVAPLAKSGNDILLSNGALLSNYQQLHNDYHIPENIHLPAFLDFKYSKDSMMFLNSLKSLDKNLFNKVVYFDEHLVSLDGRNEEKYFGLYFTIKDDLFRLQIQKSIVAETLKDCQDVILSALDSYSSFSKRAVNELEKEVYNAICYFDGSTYKVQSLVERS